MSITLAPEVPASQPSARPDVDAIKTRQKAAWASGDYSRIGTTLQIVGEMLCEALDVRSGQQLLDVAAGNGNAALAAARRGCAVMATDYVPELLERARRRAEGEELDLATMEADAENLPFADGRFEVVTSTFGVMFTPNQERAAAELRRVCASGGKIGLANWTPDGFIGQLFKTIGKHLPPPPGLPSPAVWGTRERLSGLFAAHGDTVNATTREFVFRYRSPAHWLDVFRGYYGPVHKAFAALDPAQQKQLADDLLDLANRCNRSGGESMVVPSTYLEVVVTRQ